MSEVVPDLDDGVPIVKEAEPEDAEIEHVVEPEDLPAEEGEDE